MRVRPIWLLRAPTPFASARVAPLRQIFALAHLSSSRGPLAAWDGGPSVGLAPTAPSADGDPQPFSPRRALLEDAYRRSPSRQPRTARNLHRRQRAARRSQIASPRWPILTLTIFTDPRSTNKLRNRRFRPEDISREIRVLDAAATTSTTA